ncbi:MAG: AMP-binding protein [Desulfarculus sp.]|nr:AMP-binding protein [Desulfarculus sp.]
MPEPLTITLGELLERIAAEAPEREALVDLPSGQRLTYAQFNQEATALARGFLALGLEPGQHLALWSPNRPEWLICWFAAAKAGLVLTSVDMGASSQQLAYVLAQSRSRCLVMAPGLAGGEYLDTLSQLCPEVDQPAPQGLGCQPLPDLARVVVMEGPAAPPAGALSWAGLLELGQKVPPQALAQRQAVLDCRQPATLLYTSGTTGAPKGVLSTHYGLLNTSAFGARNQLLSASDRLCLSVPLCHMFGCVCVALAGIIAGATLVIPWRAADPAATLRAVAGERCSALYGPPTSFIAMMELDEYRALDHQSLRTGIMAGAQCPIEVMRKVVEDMGVTYILNGYGQTEASSWIAQTRPHDPLELRVSTVGRPIDGVKVKVIDPMNGQALGPGQVGEICARGFNMHGYYQMPAATHAALDPAGWLHTGDLGSQDQEGYLRISGRLKEVIRRGGQIIFPAAVEEVLFTHPAINNAQVFGVDHDELGEEVACWIRLEKGASLKPDEVRDFLQGKVPDNHLPAHYKFVEGFPMTPVGKIQKFRLREMFAQEKGASGAA